MLVKDLPKEVLDSLAVPFKVISNEPFIKAWGNQEVSYLYKIFKECSEREPGVTTAERQTATDKIFGIIVEYKREKGEF